MRARADDGAEYEHLPASLTNKFQDQMMQLLDQNEMLGGQVDSMKANRGVKIDHDQFKEWTGKIDALRLEVDEGQIKVDMLAEENKLHLERIAFLEEELRRLGRHKDDLLDELNKEAEKRSKKEKGVPVARGVGVSVQTKHSGSIPEK